MHIRDCQKLPLCTELAQLYTLKRSAIKLPWKWEREMNTTQRVDNSSIVRVRKSARNRPSMLFLSLRQSAAPQCPSVNVHRCFMTCSLLLISLSFIFSERMSSLHGSIRRNREFLSVSVLGALYQFIYSRCSMVARSLPFLMGIFNFCSVWEGLTS